MAEHWGKGLPTWPTFLGKGPLPLQRATLFGGLWLASKGSLASHGGTAARPSSGSMLRAAETWIQTTAAEYVTADEEPETAEDRAEGVDGEAATNEELIAALQSRIRQLEALGPRGLPQPVSNRSVAASTQALREANRAPLLGAGVGTLDDAAWDRLRTMAGPAPRQGLLRGRCGPKFYAFSRVALELPRNKCVDLDLLSKLVSDLQGQFDVYGPAKAATGGASVEPPLLASACPCTTSGTAPPKQNAAEDSNGKSLNSFSALRIQASRIKWKHSPQFNPQPYIDSSLLRAAYADPEILRMPADCWPVARPALVHADRSELLTLARTWDYYGALSIFGARELEGLHADEEVGLFCVNKDADYDRMIVNPTVVNGRMFGLSDASKGLSPGWLLGSLHLDSGVGLRFHAADLSDFYIIRFRSAIRAASETASEPASRPMSFAG